MGRNVKVHCALIANVIFHVHNGVCTKTSQYAIHLCAVHDSVINTFCIFHAVYLWTYDVMFQSVTHI